MFMASASTTHGLRLIKTSYSFFLIFTSLPLPQPIPTAEALDILDLISESESAFTIISGLMPNACTMESGTTAFTRPEPTRSAAVDAITAAPLIPGLPAKMSVLPKLPLFETIFLSGRHDLTNSSSISFSLENAVTMSSSIHPIGQTVIFPTHSRYLVTMRPRLMHWTVTVSSALKTVPNISPVSPLMPEGISIAMR